jgi:hypothetical protein
MLIQRARDARESLRGRPEMDGRDRDADDVVDHPRQEAQHQREGNVGVGGDLDAGDDRPQVHHEDEEEQCGEVGGEADTVALAQQVDRYRVANETIGRFGDPLALRWNDLGIAVGPPEQEAHNQDRGPDGHGDSREYVGQSCVRQPSEPVPEVKIVNSGWKFCG